MSLPPHPDPSHVQKEQLEQLKAILFGQGKEQSADIIPFIEARLRQYHLGSQYQTGDVLRDTYFIAERKIIHGEITKNITALEFWLKRIAYNVIRDFSKKTRRRQSNIIRLIEKGYCTENEINHLNTLEEDSDTEENKKASLNKAFQALTNHDKEILLLRLIDDLEWKTIGTKLDLTPATARKRGQRALDRLREKFFSIYQNSNAET